MKIVAFEELQFRDYIRPGDRVTWGQCAAEPIVLTALLMKQRHQIGGRWCAFVGTSWRADTLNPDYTDVVEFEAWGAAGHNRSLAQSGLLNILSCHYSEFEYALGPRGPNRVDVLLLQVAPRGPGGRFSLSAAHEYLVPLIDTSRVVVAQVNEYAPWTFGGRELDDRDIDVLVYASHPLALSRKSVPSETDVAVARNIAGLIDDGDTLQMGMGTIPDALLGELSDRRDLGVHSGALSDEYVELAERGVITNARKSVDRGVTVAGVLMGGQRLLEHVHLNPALLMRETGYTHSIQVLAAQDRLVAINGAVEVDLTGQVNAESVGGRYVGAIGGAADFLRGARLSHGGKAVIGLPARAGSRSRIVARLNGPVSTPRSDVCFVATEYGVADLRGTTVAQRVARMMAIAHPDDRADLEEEFYGDRG